MLRLACAGAIALALAAPVAAGLAARELSPEDAERNAPVAPFRIADRLYYVGTRDISAYLIDSGAGLILLDAGYEATAPLVVASIRTLGFDPGKIRLLLNSQAHFDHAGGLAAIKAKTGAKLLASRADAPLLESGGVDDPHFGGELLFPPVKVDRSVRDGERLRLGRVALTAHLTPGHSPGCTTYTLPVIDKGRTYVAKFNCSTSVPGYRLAGNAALIAQYEATFARLKRLPCDIPLNAHGGFFGLDAKRAALAAGAKDNPFIDKAGCRAAIDRSEAAFRAQLAREIAGTR